MKELMCSVCPATGNQAVWCSWVGSQVLAGCKDRRCNADLTQLSGRCELQCPDFGGVLQ